VFTPLVWITAAYHVVKALRAPNLAAAIKTTAVWMLLAALAFLYLFSQLAAPQMFASQVLLPFYAIARRSSSIACSTGRRCSAGWRSHGWWRRRCGRSYFMFTHRRSVLDRSDVAKTNAYWRPHAQ